MKTPENSTKVSDTPEDDHVDDDMDLHADIDWLVGGRVVAESGGLEELAGGWRVAEALKALLAQVNVLAPGRSKASDGSIGDAAHASRDSDHNPWVVSGGRGIVTAIDITNDPGHGCDAGRLADALRSSRDPRIKYIISKRRIASAAPKGTVPGWTWRTYTGSNPHDKHVHISVQPNVALFDAKDPWRIDAAFDKNELAEAMLPAPNPEAEIEAAATALFALMGDGEVPLVIRLNALSEGASSLLSAYSAEIASRAGEAQDDKLEATAPAYANLTKEYADLFASCTIPASKTGVVAWHRQMLLKGRTRYQEVAKATEVPWWFIGICHALEASFNFNGHLHNGDPLSRRTVQVPPGRPKVWNPPTDWLTSAVDAMVAQGYKGAADWSVTRSLYRWEAYNGWGSRGKGIHSPYLWSFSNHYTKGKYVADHVYDPNAVSKQCGAAVMLKALQNAGDVKL